MLLYLNTVFIILSIGTDMPELGSIAQSVVHLTAWDTTSTPALPHNFCED